MQKSYFISISMNKSINAKLFLLFVIWIVARSLTSIIFSHDKLLGRYCLTFQIEILNLSFPCKIIQSLTTIYQSLRVLSFIDQIYDLHIISV